MIDLHAEQWNKQILAYFSAAVTFFAYFFAWQVKK